MLPIAHDVELRPWDLAGDFWMMTPAEFHDHIAACKRRQEREWYRTAWMTAYLLAPWSKRKLTPEKLLGKVKASGHVRARREVPQEPVE